MFITNKGIKPKRRLHGSEQDAWMAMVHRATITRVVPAKGKQPVKIMVLTDCGMHTWRAEKNGNVTRTINPQSSSFRVDKQPKRCSADAKTGESHHEVSSK